MSAELGVRRQTRQCQHRREGGPTQRRRPITAPVMLHYSANTAPTLRRPCFIAASSPKRRCSNAAPSARRCSGHASLQPRRRHVGARTQRRQPVAAPTMLHCSLDTGRSGPPKQHRRPVAAPSMLHCSLYTGMAVLQRSAESPSQLRPCFIAALTPARRRSNPATWARRSSGYVQPRHQHACSDSAPVAHRSSTDKCRRCFIAA